MNLPLVSIIIPAFNRAKIIKETLDSVVNQTYSNWECIIVDDGSNDSTVSILNEYSKKDARIKYFNRPNTKPKGANACRNYGLSLAKGYYCIFFDSDDIMASICLEQRVNHFSKHYDMDFLVFSMGIFIEKSDLQIYPSRKVVNLSLRETIEEFVLGDKIPWQVSRPIYKMQFIKEKIEFNERIQNFQDDEFHIRLLGILKPKYLSIDITDSYYRFDEASLNKYKSLKGNQDIVDCFYEFYNTVFNAFSKEQKQKNRKRLIFKFFNHVYFYLIPGIDKKGVAKTIELFDRELHLTLKERTLINSIIFLNQCYFNKKGYYYLTTKLKCLLT